MKKTPPETHFTEMLKKSGLKATPGRMETLSIMARLRIPLSAEDMTKHMKALKVDRATVYRTLSSFASAGIVKKVDLHTGSEHFELDDDHHHHLVCTECGTIEDFEACDMESTARKILKDSGFRSVDSHSLELFGICKKCGAV